jgi:hypothetical protein
MNDGPPSESPQINRGDFTISRSVEEIEWK